MSNTENALNFLFGTWSTYDTFDLFDIGTSIKFVNKHCHQLAWLWTRKHFARVVPFSKMLNASHIPHLHKVYLNWMNIVNTQGNYWDDAIKRNGKTGTKELERKKEEEQLLLNEVVKGLPMYVWDVSQPSLHDTNELTKGKLPHYRFIALILMTCIPNTKIVSLTREGDAELDLFASSANTFKNYGLVFNVIDNSCVLGTNGSTLTSIHFDELQQTQFDIILIPQQFGILTSHFRKLLPYQDKIIMYFSPFNDRYVHMKKKSRKDGNWEDIKDKSGELVYRITHCKVFETDANQVQ